MYHRALCSIILCLITQELDDHPDATENTTSDNFTNNQLNQFQIKEEKSQSPTPCVTTNDAVSPLKDGFMLTFEQEQSADELLADIQNAVDEMLQTYQICPEITNSPLHASPKLFKHNSPKMLKHVSPELLKHDSPQLLKNDSPQLLERVSPELLKHDSPELLKHDSSQLLEHDSPQLLERVSPELLKHDSPELLKHDSPELLKHDSSKLLEHDSPQLLKHDSPQLLKHDRPQQLKHDSPELFKHDSPEMFRHDSLELLKLNSPELFKHDSPKLFKHDSPELLKLDSPQLLNHDSSELLKSDLMGTAEASDSFEESNASDDETDGTNAIISPKLKFNHLLKMKRKNSGFGFQVMGGMDSEVPAQVEYIIPGKGL